MTPQEVYRAFETGFERRKFSAGLLIAFIDFFLNDESMNLMSKIGGEFVNRKGIKPPLPDVDKIQFVEMLDLDKDGYAEKAKEYDKLFVK